MGGNVDPDVYIPKLDPNYVSTHLHYTLLIFGGLKLRVYSQSGTENSSVVNSQFLLPEALYYALMWRLHLFP